MGRPRSCNCGTCDKCQHADYMRAWYQRKTIDERRVWIAQRDPITIRAHDRKRYRKHREKRLAMMKAYSKTNAGKAKRVQANRDWMMRNPSKRTAQLKVGRAIREKKLLRRACEVCGSRAQAHHDDYSKPLDVRWLCPKHHAAWHVFERQNAAFVI